jgi:hypothetical protein
MANTILMIPAILGSLRTRKDRTLTLSIETNELTPEQAGVLHGLMNKVLTMALKDSENLSALEVEALQHCEVDTFENGKTPSTRLRSVLFLTWKQDDEKFTDFNNFYVHKMEKLIDHFKQKLPKN